MEQERQVNGSLTFPCAVAVIVKCMHQMVVLCATRIVSYENQYSATLVASKRMFTIMTRSIIILPLSHQAVIPHTSFTAENGQFSALWKKCSLKLFLIFFILLKSFKYCHMPSFCVSCWFVTQSHVTVREPSKIVF